jgi:hypothetical protein
MNTGPERGEMEAWSVINVGLPPNSKRHNFLNIFNKYFKKYLNKVHIDERPRIVSQQFN